MTQSSSSRAGAIVLLAAALAGLAVALYAYITPLTGVTGTLGALVVILACLALALMALLLAALKGRGARIALRVLVLIGLVATFVAGLLLHQWWIGVAMVVGFVGLILDMCRTPHTTRPAHP
ncbi:hypothetical protein MHM84_12520 [Halomonas sp. McH1-25]|uniref:hypothetical protein n=1 Tax=unclassified Halomonas TaxID=2609666 RepID=UPI001EF3FF62|nr:MULTISPECIES: hypothetical protein [unclassified Halomonas]MCG7600616.1 hypothetical protein [Halomonas sp. McH1-25]MCP1343239.1 hypothetical protein [Halomonas sp. FL8]MCP1359935.1 hypothetical protein [Halomonas sp. BBD45]MCP1364882.1 hypothetical protein [Halomonas sp. BBD48]